MVTPWSFSLGKPERSASAQACPGRTVAYFGLVTCNMSLVAKGTSVQDVTLPRPLVPYTQLQYIGHNYVRQTSHLICSLKTRYLDTARVLLAFHVPYTPFSLARLPTRQTTAAKISSHQHYLPRSRRIGTRKGGFRHWLGGHEQ